MPNHVTNQIIFDRIHVNKVSKLCFSDRGFDFNLLIPMPPHIYVGNLSREDEQDFPNNWLKWSRENWGTKWNAYDSSIENKDDKSILEFDTAWSVPYPIIVAFANKFLIEFEHRYFDEGHNFWGVENWGCEGKNACRLSARKSNSADFNKLCLELKGYDPNKDE